MRTSRDLVASVLLFAALIGLAMLLATRQSPKQQQPEHVAYSTHSADWEGMAALAMWLEAMGYRVDRIEDAPFNIPSDAKVLFIFPADWTDSPNTPVAPFTERDEQAVMEWTRSGNTLVAISESFGFGTNRLGRALAVKVRHTPPSRYGYLSEDYDYDILPWEQPLIGDLYPREVTVLTGTALELNRDDYVEFLSNQGTTVLASFGEGEGRVWVTSAPHLFGNKGLQDEENAAVIGAMLSQVPRGSVIAFDELHSKFYTESTGSETGSTRDLLWGTPAGWAFLYALLVVFAFLLLNGQRLGRAVPAAQALVRRRPAEYIVAMAHLFRRAHKREMVLSHYHAGLVRRLARPYGISPDLPDEEFVAALAAVSHVDAAALQQTLHGLSQKRVSEQDLVKLAHQAVQFYKQQG